jgi:predicted TPR repeat methyltransferase
MRKIVSAEYGEQLKKLHFENNSFGVGNVTAKHYPMIIGLINKKKIKTVLDYGCGKGHFLSALSKSKIDVQADGFDVASDEYSVLPSKSYDLVVCLDVMEHVEFGALSNVLTEIRDRTSRFFICSVANYPAVKNLADGRNAHVTQMPFGVWFTYFSGFFSISQFIRTGRCEGLFVCSAMQTSSDWR